MTDYTPTTDDMQTGMIFEQTADAYQRLIEAEALCPHRQLNPPPPPRSRHDQAPDRPPKLPGHAHRMWCILIGVEQKGFTMEDDIRSINITVERGDGSEFTIEFPNGAACIDLETVYEEADYFEYLYAVPKRRIEPINFHIVRPRYNKDLVLYTVREGNTDERTKHD